MLVVVTIKRSAIFSIAALAFVPLVHGYDLHVAFI